MDPVGILLRTPLFGDLGVDDVEELLPDLRERRYGRGEVIWIEGDPATGLYVIAEGQLKTFRVSRDGREIILALHTAVAATGEVGLFHPGGVRLANVSAMTPATCLIVSRARLLAFMSRHQQAMERMLEQLSITAGQAAYSFSGMAFDGIGQRVASLLVTLAREHGEPTSEGLRIGARLSQTDLAAQVAASRENVNRALSAFVAGGAVSQHDGHFYVHDLAALERVAEGRVH